MWSLWYREAVKYIVITDMWNQLYILFDIYCINSHDLPFVCRHSATLRVCYAMVQITAR
jgi:hypothetical protein